MGTINNINAYESGTMSKKDLNYIKHIKPQVHEAQKRMSGVKQYNKEVKRQEEITRRFADAECRHREVCQKAAKMDVGERLNMYNLTKDPTYIGVDCNWDRVTQLGKKIRTNIMGLLEYW